MKATLSNNLIRLAFTYNPAVLQFIRTLPGRSFDPRTRTWLLPLTTAGHNLKNLEKLGFSIDPAINDALKRDITKVTELERLEGRPDATLNTSLPLYPFQRAIAAYMIKAESCLNASEVGSGKTITTLAACEYLKCQKILVICPKSAIRQWEREIIKWLPSWNIVVIEGNKQTRSDLYWQYRTASTPVVLIVSYDLARIDFNILKNMPKWDATICDEGHRLGSTPYIKTRKALKLYDTVHRFALTATPFRSNLINYYSIIDWIAPGSLGSFKVFCDRFTLRNQFGGITQYINLNEFQSRIKRHMIRKTLEEVGYQLPSLIEEDIEFDLSEKEQELYNQIKMEVLLDIDKLSINKIDNPTALNMAIVKLGKMQELCDSMELLGDHTQSTKLEILKEHLADTIVNGNKAVIFTRFERMAQILRRELTEYGPAMITGQIQDRQAVMDKFNIDENCKIMIITSAGGEAVNLQRANILYFYDVPLGSYGQLVQTIGRIKRIGQVKPMIVYYLLANGIDRRLKRMLVKKGELSDRIFGSIQEVRDILT